MEQTWTISQLNQSIKKWLEAEFPKIWIEGEISNFKKYPSGHMYFSLKDEKAQASCVMFAGFNRYLKFTPKNGSHIKIKAKVSLYPERGQFQLIAEYMEESGDGALQRAFELLKNKLQLEGLFEPKYKKKLPALPTCIGIITSPKGAAIRDILTTLKRRFPSIPIIIYPALVQGKEAAAQIQRAIITANQDQKCDVLIVGRGGGSLEDLQAFNDESLARTIFDSLLPIVSAVGHEVDFTIADFVADIRAATPTAAAELVSPSQKNLHKIIFQQRTNLHTAIMDIINQYQQTITWLRKSLKDPRQQLLDRAQTIDTLNHRLLFAMKHHHKYQYNYLVQLHHQLLRYTPINQIKPLTQRITFYQQQLIKIIHLTLEQKKQKLKHQVQLLDTLSPLQTLTRGYAIIKNKNNHLVTDVNDVKLEDNLTIQLSKGEIEAQVININPKEKK